MTDPIPLSHMVIEGFGASVHGGPNSDTLAAQLAARGVEITLDDIGRQAISRADARVLLGERAEQKAAAQRARAAAAAESPPDTGQRGRAALAERQRQLLRENPGMSAYEVAVATSGDHDRRMDRAGNVRDQLAAAERRGELGYGMFGQIKNGGH